MVRHLKFLLLDKNPEDRFIIAQALLRDFPRAVLQECQDPAAALQEIQRAAPTAVFIHATRDKTGPEIVREVRALDPALMIISLSRVPEEADAIAAGANRFLQADQWQMAGMLVKELLGIPKNKDGNTPLARPPH